MQVFDRVLRKSLFVSLFGSAGFVRLWKTLWSALWIR